MADTATDNGLSLFKTWFRLDRQHSREWRRQAKEDFDFVAGEQWDERDVRKLKEMMRPIITFNRVLPIVNAVSGQEISNRQEVRYVGREPGDAKPNELLTSAAHWFRDLADADDEDSDAFLNALICGMGWTETKLDHDRDDDGEPGMDCIDPREMYWDRSARKKNLSDAQRVWRVRQMPASRALEMFPGKSLEDLDATWARADEAEAGDDGRTQEEQDLYESGGEEPTEADLADKMVTIVHLQYRKATKVNITVDIATGERLELSDADFKRYKIRVFEMTGQTVPHMVKRKKEVRGVFLGAGILKDDPALCPQHFSFQCMTAYRHMTKGQFYGLVRQMRDPQQWANKWLSQALDIMNSSSKGGVMMEKDATDDMREFEQTWARPDKPTYVPPGTLSNANGPKVVPKPGAQMPAGFFQLMEFAISSVRDVTGISVEMLGMREADQPASLEYQRRQAGMQILAPVFGNLKRYRREHGELMLYIIQNYLSDGRLIRVIGDEGAKFVPLMRQADIRYDIIVDDQPTSPNQKEHVWQALAPMFMNLPPDIQSALLDYLPLPETVIEKVKGAMQKASEGPAAQIQQKMAALDVALKEAETTLKQAQALKTQMEAQQVRAEVGQGRLAIDVAKMQSDAQFRQQELAINTGLRREEMAGDMALEREKASAKLSLDALTAMAKAQQPGQQQPAS